MKTANNFLSVLILFILFHSSTGEQQSLNPNLNEFLQCLPQHTSPSHPITKNIYTKQNSSFTSVLQAYIRNLRYATPTTPKPLAIITATHKSHVQATILCAKSHSLQLRIRSGGHDYEGLSYVSHIPFVVLDMFNLRKIKIDMKTETAWVGSGAILGELYYKVAMESNNTRGFPGGVGHTVGVGGHITGGGYGTLIRKYGLTIDHVIDAIVVDVNGRILNRKTMGEGLFWAIRGGGAASFCVILAWKIKLVYVPKTVTVFKVPRTLEDGVTDIVYQWQKVAPEIDDNLFIRAQPEVLKKQQATVQVSFYGFYLGRADSLLSLMNSSFPKLGLQSTDCVETTWAKSDLFWDDKPKDTPLEELLNRIPSSRSYEKYKSDYVKNPISKQGFESIWKKMIQVENITMQWNPYGGAMSRIPSNATAFPHRAGNIFKIQYLASWKEEEATNWYIKGEEELHDAFTPYVSKKPREAFLNYRDLDIGTNFNGSLVFALDYFNENVMRLLQVKVKVDPENFFQYEQSIPILPDSYQRIQIDEAPIEDNMIM